MIRSRNKKTSLIWNYKNNKDKIKKLAQLHNELKIKIELDELINKINIAEKDIRFASIFFDNAQEGLK